MRSAIKFLKIRLGVPLTRREVDTFRDNMWKRYTDKTFPQEKDAVSSAAALAYLDRIVDRLINKARGILPFNSILFVIAGLERLASGQVELLNLAIAALSLSSLILINLFWVHWGDVDHYASAAHEFSETTRIVWVRSLMMQVSIFFSLTGLVFLTVNGVDYYLHTRQPSLTVGMLRYNFTRLVTVPME